MFVVKFDVSNLQRKLDDAAKRQIPFATALALTRTAQVVKAALLDEIRRVFDRPTPHTLRALYLKPATKQNLEAYVGIKDRSYLWHQVYGGTRPQKRTEENLQRRWYAPGWAAPLNAYGNLPMSTLNRIVSQLKLQRDTRANVTERSRKRNKKGAKYFAAWQRTDSGLPSGVYQRPASGKPQLVMKFIKAPTYRPRLLFAQVVQRVFDTQFKREWDKALGQAMGSALRRKF